ncbi:MAG: glutamate--cysteine ligase [Thiotrichales bacterium]
MGQEIDHSQFSAAEYAEFARRLRAETAALIASYDQASHADGDFVVGFELETCLVDRERLHPAMRNQAFLRQLNSPLAEAELALHNVEFNTTPRRVHGDLLSALHRDLATLLRDALAVANSLEMRLVMCGILPTLDEAMLTPANLSPLNRYQALHEQVLAAHGGQALQLDILGREHLVLRHGSVMLEAATTSLQIHLKVPRGLVRRAYNACLLISAPLLGLSANSPFLFGHDLWDETRIPLFEQSVALGGFGAPGGPLRRVSFGSGYAKRSIVECFEENLAHFPVLLPVLDERPRPYAHLRLHNGTIWRWNRPIVGFDDDGTPHIRIEHRTLPAGPSLTDTLANTALFLGLVRYYLEHPVEDLEFARVRDNFYRAARYGLQARLDWLDGQRHPLPRLASRQLLDAAAWGLARLGLDATDSARYLAVIAERIRCGQTGADWQRRFLRAHPGDLQALTQTYLGHQEADQPVHTWAI